MPVKPVPSADQLDPSHFAMQLAGTPPAAVKVPAAYSACPLPSSKTVSALTMAPVPVKPLPRADQLDPFQAAMDFAATPPAVEKSPPTYSAGPLPSSKTVRAST